ncbi:uncharacterized protein LOC143302102 isoform X2 [Babylonia areolata]|uniref:uncharacterized protein LOC143302102 isoform X2 n=1 Tax=Babylonia areolata TaxID=304850 RepID=UPI003FD2B27B
MAAPMQTKPKMKGGMLDNWSVKEKLALGCSVQRSGDQNWGPVSRAIKPYGESHRPADWFLPRNCATQYSSLLEKVETPKRKRGERGEVEVPAKQIVRTLTIERIEELKKQVIEHQQQYKKLKRDVECILTGQWDDQIKEKWEEAVAKKEAQEEVKKEEERKLKEMYETRAAVLSQLKGNRCPSASSHSNVSEVDDNTQDSLVDNTDISAVGDDDSLQSPLPVSTSLPMPTTPTVTTAGETTPVTKSGSSQSLALLSHLLQSSHLSSHNLQKIKQEKEQVMKQEQQQAEEGGQAATAIAEPAADIPSVEVTPSASVNSQQSDADDVSIASTTVVGMLEEKKSLEKVKEELQSEAPEPLTEEEQSTPVVSIKEEIKEEGSSQESMASSENSSDQKPPVDVEIKTEVGAEEVPEQKPEQVTDVEVESQDEEKSDVEGPSFNFINVDEEVSVKEEPPSPASSVLSNVSDTRSAGRRSRGRGSRGRPSQRVTRKTTAEKDDASSKHSEAEFTDDDLPRDADDILSHLTMQPSSLAVSAFTESVPNSPASVGISDTEDEKAHKAWKKSIMLVWRAAANHKDANVFLHPVTNDIAPGYHNVVHRPMDMQTIKKNIESGAIRTTAEFQRDMMLMFTNAIMYNSSNHKVYEMAKKMYDDVMEQIEQYVSTQLMVQSSETKVLRPSRRAEASDKEDDPKKRRSSVEQSVEGGKVKKRKVRGDE